MIIRDVFGVLEKIGNRTIHDSILKTRAKIDSKRKIVCAISGGSDSDVVLDILRLVDAEKKIKYVFYDTGIEYEATKKHLDDLEQKYQITIEREKAKMPIPLACRKYGIPFWSKYVSDMVERLQTHKFNWEDKSYDELIKQYPKCIGALRWWCNKNGDETSSFNICHIRGLKEFMCKNPPNFNISGKCCKGAKKDVAKDFLIRNKADLSVLGIRKLEGGIRATAYKSCFDEGKNGEDWCNYRPIFWFSDKDKYEYVKLFDIKHSDCYGKYGLIRTGCAGCPFGKKFEDELEAIEKYEPKLYKAVNNIFGKSYEYTRKFLEFRKRLFVVDGLTYQQQTIFD